MFRKSCPSLYSEYAWKWTRLLRLKVCLRSLVHSPSLILRMDTDLSWWKSLVYTFFLLSTLKLFCCYGFICLCKQIQEVTLHNINFYYYWGQKGQKKQASLRPSSGYLIIFSYFYTWLKKVNSLMNTCKWI